MKKIVLLACAFASYTASAQISIQMDGSGPDISGTTVDIVIDPFVVNPQGDYFWSEHFIVTNNTGSDGLWTVTRKKTNVPSTWNDQICWPPNCFPTGSGLLYTTPHDPDNGSPAPTVLDGTSTAQQFGTDYEADLKPQITPDFTTSGGAVYTYYITDAVSGVYLDSITLNFTYPLAVNDVKTPELSIAPNPASTSVKVTLDGTESATVRVVDVLGNVVYSEEVTGSKNIDVSSFKNGVYFVSINGTGRKAITKKLVVRH